MKQEIKNKISARADETDTIKSIQKNLRTCFSTMSENEISQKVRDFVEATFESILNDLPPVESDNTQPNILVDVKRLRDILTAIQNETQPLSNHPDPGAINDCWNEVFDLLPTSPNNQSI
jgi:hypothetical protein